VFRAGQDYSLGFSRKNKRRRKSRAGWRAL
jgi:hypothetical protein